MKLRLPFCSAGVALALAAPCALTLSLSGSAIAAAPRDNAGECFG
ncbi:hypothetical protein [Accumulibacter sp.]